MDSDATFADLMVRVRKGDHEAAAELVRIYEPQVLRLIRLRLTDRALRQRFDSSDICQSVLGSFFVRAALGQYDLNSPEQLVGLLTTMAHHKLVKQIEYECRGRRDVRRDGTGEVGDVQNLASGATPSEIAIGRELLERIRSRLMPEERYLVERRASGHTWSDLAQELGRSIDAVRMQVTRALDRVTHELGLDSQDAGEEPA